MSSVTQIKPGSRTQPVLVGTVGTGVPSGDDFLIKVQRAAMRFGSPANDITGDGDFAPCFDNNGMLYGEVRLDGIVPAGQVVGLLKLTEEENPVRTLKFLFADNYSITADYLIEFITFIWDRTASFVGVRMEMRKQAAENGTESLAEALS